MGKGLTRAGDLSFMKDLTAALPEPNETALDAPVSTSLQKSLDGLGRAVEERNAKVVSIQLPLWHEMERGTPNSFLRSALFAAIQSKDRVFLKEVTLASSRDVTLKFTGEQLNQEDLNVWATLVHLSRENPLGTVCYFTAHGLLKSMGLHTGGDEHTRLHSTIIRLRSATVEVQHHKKFYAGGLIQNIAGNDDSEFPEKPSKRYAIRLDKNLIALFGDDQWTGLYWEQRLLLRRKPLAEALHGYWSSHRRPIPVTLAKLQEFTGGRNQQPADFKRKVRKALEELVTVHFLTWYEIDGNLVTVRRS